MEIADELKVEPNDIMEEIRRQPNPETLKEKEEQIRILESTQEDLQSQVSWAEGKCSLAREKEKEALQLIRNLSSLVGQLADTVNKSALYDAQLVARGHVAGSKIVIILVNFQARMERVLK